MIDTIITALPYILQGSLTTISLVLGALALGFIVGLPMAVIQVYGPWWARKIVGLYVWFFRGVPILLLLFLFYFGLFTIIGLNLSAIAASCLVLGMASAAYQSQIFRGTLKSLPQGQAKAGKALGMSNSQVLRHISLPQALRMSISAWSNEYSILLKDSAICYALGAQEMMTHTHHVASRTGVLLPLYLTAAVLYLIITLVGIYGLRKLEKRVHIPGYTSAGSM